MIRIKLKVGRAGSGFSWKPGQVVEVREAEAMRLVESGKASYVDEPPPEAAMKRPPEPRPSACAGPHADRHAAPEQPKRKASGKRARIKRRKASH